MGRFLFGVVASLCIAACSMGAESSATSYGTRYSACTRVGGDQTDGWYCFADSVAIISRTDAYCDLRVVTFGYLREEGDKILLYPDRDRATHGVVTSALLIDDQVSRSTVIKYLQSHAPAGMYVTVNAELVCPPNKGAYSGVWAAQLRSIRHLSTVELDGHGNFVKERIIAPLTVNGE